jgi:hypothetical protein
MVILWWFNRVYLDVMVILEWFIYATIGISWDIGWDTWIEVIEVAHFFFSRWSIKTWGSDGYSSTPLGMQPQETPDFADDFAVI